MKKYMMMCFLLFSSIAIQAENKITMVTYFPVPYVAYSKINVNKQLDVGLASTCEMNLGCSESGAAGLKPLQVTNGFLERGRLELNSAAAVVSNQVSLGSGSGLAEINFLEDLRIGTLNNGYSLETNQMTVDILKLFPSRIKNDFPSCAATGANGAPQVSWQKLSIKGKEETFLVCGTPKQTAIDCPISSKPATSQKCNGCGTQTRSVTCDTSTGEWVTGTWSTCSGGSPSVTTQEEKCSFKAYYTYASQSDSPSTRIGPVTVSGKRTRSWNQYTCSWGNWGPCTGAVYTSLGSFTKSSNKSYCQRASSSYCNRGYGLNESCDWPQSSGLYGSYCVSPYGSGCYIYQCRSLTE